MRFKINLKAVKDTVLPNNNQHIVNGYLHKCLGKNNNYHDTHSNYSISTLQGGLLDKDNKKIIIKKDDNMYIIVSSIDEKFIAILFDGILSNSVFYDGIIANIGLMPLEAIYNEYNHFRTLSPFLIKVDNKDITIKDFDNNKEMAQFIKPIILNKLQKINEKNGLKLNFDKFDISIDWCHVNRRFVKPGCRAFNVNSCGFTLYSSKGVAELLYNIGIGQSTGAGFGCIYKSENNYIYRNEKMNKNLLTETENDDFSKEETLIFD